MDREEFIRIRTDTLLSLMTNDPCDYEVYLKAVADYYDDTVLEKEDQTIMGMIPMSEPPPYRMHDLDKPSPISTLSLPDGYEDYIAGQRKFTTTYARDWPKAHEDNQFGKRHPLSWEMPTNPLLQGAQWGEPAFVDHLLHLIEEDEEGQSIIKAMKDAERSGIVPKEYEILLGRPMESLHQLYYDDRNGRHSYLSDDEYVDNKRSEWVSDNRLGLLSYLFGLEWQTPEHREAFMDILKGLGDTESGDHPEARKLQNDIAPSAGLSWDRAKRNWFERIIPLARWWQRPSDRHGPVSAEDIPSGLTHFKSPYIKETFGEGMPHGEEVTTPSATYEKHSCLMSASLC